jgi:tight adherence protein B
VSIGLQRETGGNLTETLQNLSDLLRRRQQMRLKIKALSSEARASAYIIGSLPFIIGAMIYLVNPDYIATLFTDPTGHYMLAGAAVSEAVGVAVLIKLMNFEI